MKKQLRVMTSMLGVWLLMSCNNVDSVVEKASASFANEEYQSTIGEILSLSDNEILENDSLMYMLATSYYTTRAKFSDPAGFEFNDLAISKDLKLAAVADGGQYKVKIFSIPELSIVAQFQTYDYPYCVAFNPAADEIAVGTNTGDVYFYDIYGDGEAKSVIGVSGTRVRDLEFLNGDTLIVCGNDQHVKALSISEEMFLWTNHAHSRNVKGLTLTDNNKYAVTASNDGTAAMVDIASGNTYRTFAQGDNYVNAACTDHACDKLYAAGGNSILKVFRMGQMSPEYSVSLGEPLSALAVSPDDKTVAVGASKSLFLLDAEKGKAIARIPISGNCIWGVGFVGDDKLIYIDKSHIVDIEILTGEKLIEAARRL